MAFKALAVVFSLSVTFYLGVAIHDETMDTDEGELSLKKNTLAELVGAIGRGEMSVGGQTTFALAKVMKQDPNYKNGWPLTCRGDTTKGNKNMVPRIRTNGYRCHVDNDKVYGLDELVFARGQAVCCDDGHPEKAKCSTQPKGTYGCTVPSDPLQAIAQSAQISLNYFAGIEEDKAKAAAAAAAAASPSPPPPTDDGATDDDHAVKEKINKAIADVLDPTGNSSSGSIPEYVKVGRVANTDQPGVLFDVELRVINRALAFEAGSILLTKKTEDVLGALFPVIKKAVIDETTAKSTELQKTIKAVFCVHGATYLKEDGDYAPRWGGGRANTIRDWLNVKLNKAVPMGEFVGKNYHTKCEPIAGSSSNAKFSGDMLASIMYKVYDAANEQPQCRSSDFYKFYSGAEWVAPEGACE